MSEDYREMWSSLGLSLEAHAGQLKTRVEAFVEMIRDGKRS